jgi:cytochrome c oxidase subunit 3
MVAHHFDDAAKQHEAVTLGMWAFLVQEVMFFGALLVAYAVYRTLYPEAWLAGSGHLNVTLGALNTAVLLGSSFAMAYGVRAAQLAQRSHALWALAATLLLGAVFLLVKYLEYSSKWHHHLVPGGAFVVPTGEPVRLPMFFTFYFVLTGAHALHMIIGMGIIAWLLGGLYRHRFLGEDFAAVEMTGLYWHFVDIVWIFLFPLLYLLGRHA